MASTPRIAIVVSHPIQHFCPQYASLATSSDWHLKVFFASSMGKDSYHDKGFDRTVAWTGLPLDDFDHEFLSASSLPSEKHLDAPQLDEALKKFAPDVVIVYGHWQKVQRRAMAWARVNGCLLYYISDSEMAHRPGWPKRIAKAILMPRIFGTVDRFLTVGTWNELYYHGFGVSPQQMTRMNFPIDIRLYDSALKSKISLRKEIRREYALGTDDFVVSTVGKLVPWKRQRDIVLAVGKCPAAANLKAIVVGSGPDQIELEKMAQEQGVVDRIRFLGFVDPQSLPGVYAASDAYIHLSSLEPHSLAISEAIYCGLPAIVSDRCGSYGPNDDVQEGANGFVYPVGDLESLTDALLHLARSPNLVTTLSGNSRSFAYAAQQRAHGEFLREALVADRLLS